MSDSSRRSARHFSAGTGLYIALFLGLTALAVAGYWMLLPSPADRKADAVPVEPTPIIEPAAPVLPAEEPTRKAETPVSSSVPLELPDAKAVPSEPVAPVPPRLVIAPVEGETVAAFSMDALTYSETLADWRTHDGIDIEAALGSQVLAACSGTVLSVSEDDLMGTTVILDHGDGCATTYANLQPEPPVAPGQYVSAGQVIGTVGSTSLAEAAIGAHLHFSVTQDGQSVDPQEFLQS